MGVCWSRPAASGGLEALALGLLAQGDGHDVELRGVHDVQLARLLVGGEDEMALVVMDAGDALHFRVAGAFAGVGLGAGQLLQIADILDFDGETADQGDDQGRGLQVTRGLHVFLLVMTCDELVSPL